MRRNGGSRSACELRSTHSGSFGRQQTHEKELSRSASGLAISALLPPIELRGICAFPRPLEKSVSSLADSDNRVPSKDRSRRSSANSYTKATAARAAEAVLSPKRSAGHHSGGFGGLDLSDGSGGDSSDDNVSQFTASSCSTVRGFGYPGSESAKSSARGPHIGGHRSRRPRRTTQNHENLGDGQDHVCCPRGHELMRSERNKHWFCHGCGRVSSTCQMECFRCNRCNYNLCDTCYSTQVDDTPEPPYGPPRHRHRPSGTCSPTPSVPQSIDDLISRSNDDHTLPAIPPAFCRGLSPPPNLSARTGTADSGHSEHGFRAAASGASTGLSWMSRSGGHSGGPSRKKSTSPPRWDMVSGPSRRSSSSSISIRQVDPMLRIVSLSQWIAESGLFDETLAEYAMAQRSGGDTSAVVKDLAEMMVKGHSYMAQGSSRQRLDKAALEQLHRLSRCHTLPLEDVHEDLKIWHLTLLRRPDRKKIALSYGRVTKRQDDGFEFDPEVLARMKEEGALTPQGGKSGHGAGPYDYSGLSGGAGGFGPGGQGRGPGGADGYGGFGEDGQPLGAGGWTVPTGGGFGPDGKPLGGGRGPGGAGEQGEGELGPDGKPIGKGGQGGRDSRRGSGASGESGDEGKTDGGLTGSRPDSGGGIDGGEAGDQSGRAGARAGAAGRGSVRAGQSASDKEKAERELGNMPEEDGDYIDEEKAEELRLLASGAIFRVKKRIAEQVILDEFANMLLPPPPLSAVTGGDKDANADAEEGTTGGSQTRRQMQSSMPSAAMGALVRSNLAEDFRKCVLAAFQLIDYPAEAKMQRTEEAEVEAFLRDDTDDPELRGLLSRSNTSAQLNTDSSLLETHLRMRAEKRGRRLQKEGQKAMHSTQDCWSRRLQGCKQALQAVSALDTFAMMRARAALVTA